MRPRASIVRLGTAPRAQHLDYAGFQAHWRGEHASLAGNLPGLRGYVQNHAVLRDGIPLLPYAGFDACSEIAFDSLEAMDAAFASEIYRGDVVGDEHALIDRTRFQLALLRRRTVREGARDGAVKLLSFWRVAPRSSLRELDETLATGWAAAVDGAGHVRHDQLIAIADAHEGRPGPVCDALDVMRFDDADAALAFIASDAAQQGLWRLSGIGGCVGRLIATEVVVV